jgi:SNF2 family DNA or RNA helicase
MRLVAGVRWLYLLHRLGLGACLADDMGLGKTIQVLSLLLILKHESTAQRAATPTRTPSLLVAPASLLANWAAEIERFAPTLRFLIAHPSASSAEDLKAMTSETRAVKQLIAHTRKVSFAALNGAVIRAVHSD